MSQNETGRFVGTAFTAQDTMRVVEVLEEDKMIRFWGEMVPLCERLITHNNIIGMSYGTLLGATILGMFPNRVDKMVLDGVINPIEYYRNTLSIPNGLICDHANSI